MAKPVYSYEEYVASDRKLKVLFVGRAVDLLTALEAFITAESKIGSANGLLEERLEELSRD